MEKAEKIGLGVATAGHALLFLLLSSSFLVTQNAMKFEATPIEVDMVSEIALQTTAPKVSLAPPPAATAPEKGPVEEAKPTPAPPTPKLAPAPPAPPAPRAAPAKPSKPAPAPAAKPSKPAPAPVASKPVARAPAKPNKPAAAAPADSRDRRRPDRPAPAAARPAAPTGKGTASRPTALALSDDIVRGAASERTPNKPTSSASQAAAMGPQQKAALNAEIRRQLKPYWKAPTGADADQLRTELRVRLAKDGSVIGTPEVVGQTGITASNRAQAVLHAEQAIKAVRLASPFRLPPEFYEQWKLLDPLGFDRRLSQ